MAGSLLTGSQDSVLVLGYLNIRGQTKLTKAKQLMIEDLAKKEKLDILNLQEAHIDDESFEDCEFIQSQFQIIRNNAENGYGVCSLVKRNLAVSEIQAYPGGRILSFVVGKTKIGNVYLPSGNEGRSEREEFCGKIIPEIFLGAANGCLGGDWNAITNAIDTTSNPEQKMSRNLSKLGKTFNWVDGFRALHPNVIAFSHAYRRQGADGLQEGASRLDRVYAWGRAKVEEASYIPAALSDHFMHKVRVRLPEKMSDRVAMARPYFKISPELARDEVFKLKVQEVVDDWLPAKNNMDLLEWWDLVKSDIREEAKKLTVERKRLRSGELNYLMLLQTFLAAKVAGGDLKTLSKLRVTQERIKTWFEKKSEEVFTFAGIRDAAESETTRSYHYEKLTRARQKGSISRLKSKDGAVAAGHQECASLLAEEVQELFGAPVELDQEAQQALLSHVDEVFTEEDNRRLVCDLTDEEVKASLGRANRLSSPGSDAICYTVYHACWNIIGPHLCDVLRQVIRTGVPTMTQRHAYLVFTPKAGKEGSDRSKDLRRLFMCQTDLKLLSASLAERLKRSEARTLSPMQFSAGPRRIAHAISKARDVVDNTKPTDRGCAVVETDFVGAYEKMSVSWVWKVLQKKKCDEGFVSVLRAIYEQTDSFIIPMVNNEPQKRLTNKRKNIRTGDSIATCLFNYGVDPLLILLNKKLKGIEYFRCVTQGPAHPLFGKPRPVSEKVKVIGFVDDVKGFLSSREDFTTLDSSIGLFERSTGAQLHRETESKKCQVLPLGKWKKWKQADCPLPYVAVVSHLSFLGVKLGASLAITRRLNGEDLVEKVQNKINHFKVSRHVP